MAYKVPWAQPYPDMVSMGFHQVSRLTIEVPRKEVETIKSVLVHPSAISLICQLAIKQTAEYVRTNNLTYPEDAERFLKFICERTFSESTQAAVAHDDAGAGNPVRVGTQATEDKPAGAGKKVKSGKSGKRGKGIDGDIIEGFVQGFVG